jgi:hypothetical protein
MGNVDRANLIMPRTHSMVYLAHGISHKHVDTSKIEIVGDTVVIPVRVEDMQHHSSVSFSGRHSLGIIDDHRHIRSTSSIS